MTKDKFDAVLGAYIGNPVPAEHARNADYIIVQVGEKHFKEQPRVGFNVLMHFDSAALIQDADAPFPGLQIACRNSTERFENLLPPLILSEMNFFSKKWGENVRRNQLDCIKKQRFYAVGAHFGGR